MFLCYLCENERCYTSYFCEDCRKIKNIMNVYGKQDVLSILQTACLRDQTQIGYKLNKMIKDSDKKIKPSIELSETAKKEPSILGAAHGLEPIKTRSSTKKNSKN
jgi:hypothetical protein